MPEGPSIVIAREEMIPAIGKKVSAVAGNSREPIATLKGRALVEIGTWGKHLLLFFDDRVLKIHFMLWGSYSINEPKENRQIRLSLKFKGITIYFYACSVKFLQRDVDEIYDWSADVMNLTWDAEKALLKIKADENEMVCDVLMDQDIFSGVGNIIKNEVLFILRLLPQRKIQSLTEKDLRKLIETTHAYTWQFYEWKKVFELKKKLAHHEKIHLPCLRRTCHKGRDRQAGALKPLLQTLSALNGFKPPALFLSVFYC